MNRTGESTLNEKLRLPLGFFDKTGEELRRQRVVEGIFRSVGSSLGYQEIETPILEHADTLPLELFSCWKKQGFIGLTLTDYDEHFHEVRTAEVILRPEGTIPVCRWLATKLTVDPNALPVKIIYSIDCYRNEPVNEVNSHKRRQFNQLGVESIGDASLDADKEVIEYACSVMEDSGIKSRDMRIRLNNIQLFKRLCDDSGFDEKTRYSLQERIDGFSKQRALGKQSTLELPEHECLLDTRLRERWSSLLTTYDPSPEFLKGIDAGLYEIQRDLKGRPIVVDTSVVRGFSYYTGPVFQIDVRKEGEWAAEIGGGGRYDELIGQNLRTFDIERKVPATGFAFGTERLVQCSHLPKGTYMIQVTV